MNNKKIMLSIVSSIILIILMIVPNVVNAVEGTIEGVLITPLNFGIIEYRDGTVPANMAYAIKDPYAGGHKIWQIVKYENESNYTPGDYYCVRAEVGFSDTSKSGVYTNAYDLVKEKGIIASLENPVLQSIVNNEYYNNLIALFDLLYLKDTSTLDERTELLRAAGIDESKLPESARLTDSDIEAVQQAAVWYYTEHGNTVYDNYDSVFTSGGELTKTSWLTYNTKNGGGYTSLSDYNLGTKDGKNRQESAVWLYNYLIYTANNNASAYGEDGTATPRTRITLYANNTVQNTQPLVLLERIPEENKIFDLALRKYITKIEGQNVTQTRNPDIDESSLEEETTATYKHRKDPVSVKKGNTVTYNLTIYNEGNVAGRATKIVDQLPTGLKIKTTGTVTSTKGNVYSIDENKETNTITLNTNGTTNLNAYTVGSLDSDTISIECVVMAEPDKQNDKILTNIAWIQEQVDETGKLTDRDSVPSIPENHPNKDELVTTDNGYTGKNTETNLADVNHYYEGQEDDDDFEKIKLEPEKKQGKYSIVLVKEDKNGEDLKSTATFEVDGQRKEVTGRLEIVKDAEITEENLGIADIYRIKEIIPPDEYCKFDGTITVKVTKKEENGEYKAEKVTYTVTDETGDITEKTKETVKVYLNENGNIYVEVKNYQFDLKLIKRIVEVNGEKVPERLLGVDVSKLATGTETTATYKMNKNPVYVKKGDIVKYTIRVYNEGDIAGYASEITENIPEGLEFIWSEKTEEELEADKTITKEEKEAIKYNQGIWDFKTINKETNKVEEVTTDYLAKYRKDANGNAITTVEHTENLIKAFDAEKGYVDGEEKNPDYKEISVYMKVIAENATGKIIRNEAAITEDTDSEGNPVEDRDSDTEEWKKENSDKYYNEDKWPVYKEDDEDYDNITLKSFDLALRKFITGVDEKEVTTRIPEIKYNKENNQITYEHTKEPVEVVTGNIVTYTIRVYNEGEVDGYASRITDDIPDGLEYLPENELNKEYRWVMYDEKGEETTEVGKAVKITTDYLSKEQGEERVKKEENAEGKENPALLTAFDKEKGITEGNPDYADVKIAFKVIEPNGSSKILVNSAQISEDTDSEGNPIDDKDSIPDKWNEGEDDQDKEYVKLTYFDLALRKWVTHAIVVENGKETITQTGHKPEDDPEQVVKVELNRKKLSKIEVKFKYSIRITNEGDIAGYAKEITDYVPEGLKFVEADNPDWKDEGNNVISTRKLENKLLQPGESADVEVTLTWIKGTNNLGLKTNIAEISEDYNDKKVPDRDSTPDNKKSGEDDIDDAPVLLSVSTGGARIYYALGFTVLITVAGGIVLIKKFLI